MTNMHTNRYIFTAFPILILLWIVGAIGLCDAQESGTKDPPLGVLKLEGNHLDYIELFTKDGHTERITRPEETVKLPPGEYRLQQVRLKGGYTYYNRGISAYIWTTVAADKPATFKVGAPLVPTIKVQRQGRILRFSYELLGAGGEAYSKGDRSNPPTFAIYKGDKQIASGKFEFG
jgi:hypothetical protein